jgi:adenylyl- and sulfurtransferase ThiI
MQETEAAGVNLVNPDVSVCIGIRFGDLVVVEQQLKGHDASIASIAS